MGKGFYIAVEGPIGVGKTSLAKILVEDLNARLVLENVSENPFLADYYNNPKRFAFQTQITFLILRHRQQTELRQKDLFGEYTVSEYVYEKDNLFASLTLDEKEYNLYQRIAGLLEEEKPNVPDLVVLLQSTPERLLTNIRIRGVPYESNISVTYLKDLCEMYNRFFFGWDKSPILIINTSQIDFVKDQVQRSRLVNLIKDMPSGTTYFNPEIY